MRKNRCKRELLSTVYLVFALLDHYEDQWGWRICSASSGGIRITNIRLAYALPESGIHQTSYTCIRAHLCRRNRTKRNREDSRVDRCESRARRGGAALRFYTRETYEYSARVSHFECGAAWCVHRNTDVAVPLARHGEILNGDNPQIQMWFQTLLQSSYSASTIGVLSLKLQEIDQFLVEYENNWEYYRPVLFSWIFTPFAAHLSSSSFVLKKKRKKNKLMQKFS